MLLLDEAEGLPEVVLRLLVVAHGVVGVRDVLAQRCALAQDFLHLVEEGQGLPELGLLPAHEGNCLDGLQLVLVGPLPAHGEDLLQVVRELVQPVELDAIVKQREEGLQRVLVVQTLLLAQLLVPRLQLPLVLLLLLNPLGVIVVVFEVEDVEVIVHYVLLGQGLVLLLCEAPPVSALLLAEHHYQLPSLSRALQLPIRVVNNDLIGKLMVEDGGAGNQHGEA
mmetsp:Transcript_66650/g.206368  ORF Transcript_66650/g.206368 Transcript_66650/m.206368 type:complete len:223 (-) Transcript_66650:174-842(-)